MNSNKEDFKENLINIKIRLKSSIADGNLLNIPLSIINHVDKLIELGIRFTG